MKFGSCLVQAVSENDVISIPGIRSQAPREIYVKTLAGIINARTKMIMEQVNYEINLSGFGKKLIAGIVLTGGGAQLKNIKDLCELITTTDTRIGVPNEHLDFESVSYADLAHPMYATGIGLVLYGLEQSEREHAGEQFEEESKAKDDHVDIFAGMDDIPSATQPAAAAEPEPKKKDKKKVKFEDVVGNFINKMFNEGLDD